MASTNRPTKERSIADVVAELDCYPLEAFEFVQRGLTYTVRKTHGAPKAPGQGHVSGQQLCEGLRELALAQWGYLARTVLRRWDITCTLDFGRIIFALVENGLMQASEGDSVEDFRNVYDFATAFELDYRIESRL